MINTHPHIAVQGASDDILNAKNMLYQHLTWDPEKTVSLCSKLALPLATPAIGVTPPVSPKSAAAADGEQGSVLAAGAQPWSWTWPGALSAMLSQCWFAGGAQSVAVLLRRADEENTHSSHQTVSDQVLPTLGSC